MIRFRLGDRFHAALAGSGAAALRFEDALGIEVDGVEISGGVLEDPLIPAVAALASAVGDLASGLTRLAAVPFADGEIELLLARRGDEVALSLVSLARPSRVLVRDLSVDLAPLVEAARRCAGELLDALAVAAPEARSREPAIRLAEAIERLSRSRPDSDDESAAPPCRLLRRPPAASSAPALGFDLRDDVGRLTSPTGTSGLHALLAPGHVYVHGSDGEELLAVAGSPFLILREASEAAARLLRAARNGRPAATIPLGDGPSLEVDLAGGAVTVAGRTLRCPPEAVARATFEGALGLAGAILARNGQLAANPYLASLAEDARVRLALCRERLGEEPGGRTAPAPPAAPERPTTSGRPLAVGALRRVALRLAWRAYLPSVRSAVRVGDIAWLVTDEGVAALGFADGSHARPFESRGRMHLSAAGARSPLLLLDEQGRIEGLRPDGRVAWSRDGEPPVHELAPRYSKVLRGHGSPTGVVLAEGRILLGLALETGRTVFRLAPPGASRIAVAVAGPLAAVAADTGMVYAADAATGDLAWRARLDEPAIAVAVTSGRVMVATSGKDGATLHGFDARSGARAFRLSPGLSTASALRPVPGGVVASGEGRDGGELLEIGVGGEVRWRIGWFAGKAPAIAASGRALFARGSQEVCRIEDGRRLWRAPTAPGATPVICRGVVALPGDRLALLDATNGREISMTGVSGDLPAADHVLGSSQGILVVGDREGTVAGVRLAGALAVLAGTGTPRWRPEGR